MYKVVIVLSIVGILVWLVAVGGIITAAWKCMFGTLCG